MWFTRKFSPLYRFYNEHFNSMCLATWVKQIHHATTTHPTHIILYYTSPHLHHSIRYILSKFSIPIYDYTYLFIIVVPLLPWKVLCHYLFDVPSVKLKLSSPIWMYQSIFDNVTIMWCVYIIYFVAEAPPPTNLNQIVLTRGCFFLNYTSYILQNSIYYRIV